MFPPVLVINWRQLGRYMAIQSLNLRYAPPALSEWDRLERDRSAARDIEHVKMTLNDWLNCDGIFKPNDGLGESPTKAKLIQSNADWVYACVTAIAGRIMSLPYWLTLERRTKGGVESALLDEHVFTDLLANPNPVTTGAELWWLTASDLELTGDAYWLMLAERGKWPTQIWRLPPDAVWCVYDGKGQIPLEYMVDINGGTWRIDPQWIAPFRLPGGGSENPWHGSQSPLQAAARATDLSLFTQIYQGNFYKNNARPDFLITFPPGVKINQETLKAFKAKWDGAHKGLDAAHKWGVLGDGADIKTISITDNDRRYIEVSEMTRDKILAVYKVPASKLGLTTDVNRANAESADYTFNKETIDPLATLIASAINKYIIGRYYQPAVGRGAKLVFQFENPVPKDSEREQKLLLELMQHGILTPNDVATELGWEAFDEGDQRLIKTGLIPFEQVGMPSLGGFDLAGLMPKAAKAKALPARVDKRARYARMKQLDLWREVGRELRDTGKVPVEAHAELYARHLKGMKPKVKPMRTALNEAFRAEEERVLQAVRAEYGKALDRIDRSKPPEAILKYVRKQIDIDALFDAVFSLQVFADINKKYLTDMLLDALEATLLTLTGQERRVLTARAVAWLQSVTRRYAADVVDTTKNAIKAIIRDGLVEGLSVADVAGKIETLYDGFTDWRSEMIARTELNAASNAGAHEGYRESGVVARERWLSALDERTRRQPASEFDHWVANGEKVQLGEPFTRTGGALMFPGDPDGDPGNTILCRCSTVPVIEADEEE